MSQTNFVFKEMFNPINKLEHWSGFTLFVCYGQKLGLIFCKQQCTGLPHGTGGDPRVVVSTAAFPARVRGSVPGLGGLKETKIVSSPSTCESQY